MFDELPLVVDNRYVLFRQILDGLVFDFPQVLGYLGDKTWECEGNGNGNSTTAMIMRGIVKRTEIVGDDNNTTLELFDSDRQGVDGFHVQMIGRLIWDAN